MNKLTKITVISAVLITSGFTQQQATISGDITNNNIFEIGNGVTVNMADGSVIHNYADITGSGEIDGTANATIINYNHIVEATENDPNCFRPTGGGSVEGTINKTNVTVTDQKADITVSFDASNKVGNTILLTTDSCDADTDKILTMTNTSGNPVDVFADISNESGGSGVSHSLNVDGDFTFNGDQSRFNQNGTAWNVNSGSSSIATGKAFPQTEVNVNNGSELNINAPGVVTASKDVTVTGSQLNISNNSRFRLDKGVTLWFKGPPSWIVKVGTPGLSNIAWDNDTTWLLLKRNNIADPNYPLLSFRTDGTKVGIMEAGITDTYNTKEGALEVVVGDNALIKGSQETGYQKGKGKNALLEEIDILIAANGTWTSLADYVLILPYGDASQDKKYQKNNNITNVVIPYGVERIGNYVFSSCANLSSVIIPNSVTMIGEASFSFCRNLSSVTIPNSVITIGSGVFSSCSGLTNVTISDSVETIGDGTFYSCTKLTSMIIPNSVITIGVRFFYGCTKLTSITIPASVTTIGGQGFYGCTKLANITFLSTAALPTIGTTFTNCSALTTVTVTQELYNSLGGTDSTIITALSNAGATAITNVLQLSNDLKSVTVPASVTQLGEGAFSNSNYYLENVIFESKTWTDTQNGGDLNTIRTYLGLKDTINITIPE